MEVEMSAKEAADIKQSQIDEAKARAQKKVRTEVSVDGPEWERVTLEDATTLMEIFQWEAGAKYGFSISSDGQSIMARVACPKDSDVKDFAGMVSFVFGSNLDHAIRKVAQLHNGDFDGFWKKDSYAK
jgi:hypothetical protein